MIPISDKIWNDKYRLKEEDGTPIDQSVEATWARVARALAEAESEAAREHWFGHFLDVLMDGSFTPAGRIIAGAGTGRNVTLLNCLAAETLILTAEYGLVAISEIVGETVHVLDGNGDWTKAPINSFGEQPLQAVTLRGGYNGRVRKTIRATPNHRWIMAEGPEKVTQTLSPGDALKRVKRRAPAMSGSYREGVRHGVVYGDGSQRPKGESYLRLCGGKAELLGFFEEWNQTLRDGDPHLYLGRDQARSMRLKALPATDDPAYLTGFLHGWMATDGCVARGKAILSCGAEEADWLRRYGAVAGMEVSSVSKLVDETNYGPRNKVLFNVHLHRWTMNETDFLLTKHRDAFADADYAWVVESVGEVEEAEPVFCPRVTTTDSVMLDLGIHTGQCFTMGTIPDSMGGIFQHLREAALTMQAGGGIGYDFSTIRPKGAPVKGVSADASGPLTFMDVWDAMCRTVMSAGSRRGAMMATMRCDHPDIEAFIDAKAESTRLRMFNLSVLVTDEFMKAVRANGKWVLKHEVAPVGAGEPDENGRYTYGVVRARDLWDRIMRNTYDHAEPGVIFIDRVNAAHNLNYLEDKTIATTNPCGEQPMPPYSSCLLGSVNLARVIVDPFGEKAHINRKRLKEVVSTAVRMMDNVIDVSRFPLPEQAEVARQERRIGLGITGLADALVMCGLRYGSEEAAQFTSAVMRSITVTAYETSIKLAEEKGEFPLLSRKGYLTGTGFAANLPYQSIRRGIEKHGIRNSLLTSIAPTGTISLFAGNVSSGIEPIFALEFDRKVLQPDGSHTIERVEDWAVAEFRRLHPGKELPDSFVTMADLTPEDHVRMQAAAQEWVDSSISKTVNVPEDIDFESFKAIYERAYDSGCKGCTTYRPNAVTGSILSVAKPEAEPEAGLLAGLSFPEAEVGPDLFTEDWLSDRPRELPGVTYKLKLGGEAAFYVTITDVVENGHRRPFEVFINTKNPDHHAWTTALTRMVSAIFRRPWDSSFVVQELKEVFDPKGGGFLDGRYVHSVPAAIGGVIEQHMRAIGYLDGPNPALEALKEASEPALVGGSAFCPACHSRNVVAASGCLTCWDCGHSKCG